MKNLATLKSMDSKVITATQALRQAIYENLKELAVEVPVRSDEDLQAEDCPDYDPTERKGLYVYGPGKHYSLDEYRIDAVKAGEHGIICHYCERNEREADGWDALEEFYDCENILDCIQWPESIDHGEAEEEHGKQINLDYDAGDIVTWHCDDDGQDHTSTITGISIEVNSEGEAEVTYKTEIEFRGHKQDAYFSEYDIVNK